MMTYNDGTVKDYITKREVFLYDKDRDMNIHSIQYMNEYESKIKEKNERNDKCVCGSGKKYKYCCIRKYDKQNKLKENFPLTP